MNADTNILAVFTFGLVVLSALPAYLIYGAYQKKKQFRKEIEKQFDMMKMMLESQRTLENMVQLCKKQLVEDNIEGEEQLIRKFQETKQSPFWILYYGKLETCKNQMITVEEEVSVEREELLGTVEMISLLGNVLDNAIEACMGLEPDRRKIHVLLKQEMNLFLLEVTNTKRKSLVLARTGLSTSKSDHLLHGYGVQVIKAIVKRHQGELYVKDNGSEFFLLHFFEIINERGKRMENGMMMSYLIYQMVCLYKDYWTYPENTSFRWKKQITAVIWGTLYLFMTAVIFYFAANKIYTLSEISGIAQIPICLLNTICIRNSFQNYARYEIYWGVSFSMVTFLLGIMRIPYELIGEFEQFLDVRVLLWTYLVIGISLIVCRFLWKRKVLHGIPQGLCNCIYLTLLVWMVWSPEGVFDSYISEVEFSVVQIEMIAVFVGILAVIGMLLRLQKAKMLKEEYYYECFYTHAEQIQKRLGVLRHEFANHREVMRHLPENNGERARYLANLEKIYQEVQIPEITGAQEADRFFQIFQELAEKTGHPVEIRWETDRIELPENLMKDCIAALSVLPKKKYIFSFVEENGKLVRKKKRCRDTKNT